MHQPSCYSVEYLSRLCIRRGESRGVKWKICWLAIFFACFTRKKTVAAAKVALESGVSRCGARHAHCPHSKQVFK